MVDGQLMMDSVDQWLVHGFLMMVHDWLMDGY